MKRAMLVAGLGLLLAVSPACSTASPSSPDANYGNFPDAPGFGNPDAAPGHPDAAMNGGDAASVDASMTGDGGTKADAGMNGDGGAGSAQTVYYFGDIKTNNTDVVATIVLPDKTKQTLSLTGFGTTVNDIALSQNGSRLAVSGTDASGKPVINVYDAAGGGAATTIATGANTGFGKLAFSPDGKLVAFIGDLNTSGSNELYVAAADGSGSPKRISPPTTASTSDLFAFAWAPDSKHVAFTGDLVTDKVNGLWTVDATAATPAPVQIVKQSELNTNQGVDDLLAFDSQSRLYFTSDFETDNLFRLYRANLDGSGRERVPGTGLTNGSGSPASVGSFGISPDGTKLAFSEDSPTANLYQVYVLDLTKTTAKEVSNIPDAAQSTSRGPSFFDPIVWSPDGSQLAVIADWPLSGSDPDNAFSAFIVPASGTAGETRVFHASAANNVQELAFTADGSFLILRGDLVTDTDNTIFATSDFTTADQDPSSLQLDSPPTSGDVFGFVVAP